MTAARLSIAEINALDREAFVARFGAVYERSPWVAVAAWQARPFADRETLARAMQDAVLRAGRDRQLGLLRAHPRLGTRLALTGFSKREQARAGIAAALDAERTGLQELNARYEARFGFPFILAVRNATVAEILANCRQRVSAQPGVEFDEALRQVFRIAAFRIGDLC